MLLRRSVRTRILVLVLIPVVALIALYAVVISLTLGQLLTLRHAADMRTAVTLPTTNVQLQLARERQLVLAYLASGLPEPPTALALQQAATDEAVAAYGRAAARILPSAGLPERRSIITFRQQLTTLSQLRAFVASRRLTANDAADGYTSILSGGDNVLTQSLLPLVSNAAGTQALDVVALDQSLQAMLEEGDLIRADLIARAFSSDDLQLISSLATKRLDLWNQAYPDLDPTSQHYLATLIPPGAATQVTVLETQILAGPRSALQVSPHAWAAAEDAYVTGFHRGLLRVAGTLQADSVLLRLILGGIGGLLVIGLAVGVAITVSRGLLRQLNDLRLSALDLASRGLPSAIARLRAGDDFEAEPEGLLLDATGDEIGQVRQAFNAAAQTAVAAAVEEIRIRGHVNDVFRNLARRNQSLLTRQLELLDAMERRVHDPDQLSDLFRIDHLTTRMRRHAEGLLIMAGGSSGRTWREPVALVDVMRAASAEVESYTRIRVASRTSAALAGHAVADVIHLLAELLENATIFSPANTPVRIEGDRVARGLALEIEDRGLGMSEERLAEINATLSSPPLFDMSGSDQLGLFIAGLLAKRHDIKITLRASAYGGIIAVVLIPRVLVVDVEGGDDRTALVSIRELGGRPIPQLVGAPAAAPEPQPNAAEPPDGAPGASGEPIVGAIAQADTPIQDSGGASAAPNAGTDRFRFAVTTPTTPLSRPAAAGPGNGSWLPTPTADHTGPPARGDNAAGPGEPPGAVTREDGQEDGSEELDGLPVRVRQANLAPQLSDRSPAAPGGRPAAPEQESPEAARRTMAAWQRGWERGRLASEHLTGGPAAGSGPDPDESPGSAAPGPAPWQIGTAPDPESPSDGS